MKENSTMPQQANYIPAQCIEEDEIDLRELFATIWSHKGKIAAFTTLVVSLTLIYVLSTPNVYSSKAVLAPQGEKGASSLGGLGALAGMAGISVGGGQMDAFTSLKTILEDYDFQKYVIKKHHLIDRWYDENLTKDYVFALGYDGLFKYFHSKPEYAHDEETLYKIYKALTKSVSISSDKKSGAITLSAEHPNRFFAKDLVMVYLDEGVNRLRENEMLDMDKKISYYEKALNGTSNIQLKGQLSQMISALIQKKVLAQSNRYYNVQPVVMPGVANVMDKKKPKRGLILVVAFITSIILGIFGVFFLEFLKGSKEDEAGDAKVAP